MRGRIVKIRCPQCRQWRPVRVAARNAAKKAGRNIYCSRVCSGLGRRAASPVGPRNPNWKAMKSEYDRKRREIHGERLRAEKREKYKTWGPLHRDLERERRKKRMPYHVQYCRQPEYRKYKQCYDQELRAAEYGEYADAYRLLLQLQKEIRVQEPDRFVRYAQSQRHQWSPLNQQKAREKRAHQRINILESIRL